MSRRSQRTSENLKKPDSRIWLEEACTLFASGERSKSVKLFLKSARSGVIEAQVNLANIYDDGDGVKKDFDEARYWYKQAIKQGSPEAAHNLGISYVNKGNDRWGKHWLLVAKSMGDGDADTELRRLAAKRTIRSRSRYRTM